MDLFILNPTQYNDEELSVVYLYGTKSKDYQAS
jgi:hypothetical protein